MEVGADSSFENEIILHYFAQRYSNNDIHSGISEAQRDKISIWILKRRLESLELSRRTIASNDELKEIFEKQLGTGGAM